MKKLPDEYIVKCDEDAKKCKKVYSNFYNDEFEPSGWTYIVCSPQISNAQFIGPGKYSSGHCIVDRIDKKFAHLPVLTYKEWEKLKEMKKEIIGYRLVKPEYYQASSYIMYKNRAGSISLDDYLPTDHYALHRLEEAGVLDLWFEPVYKEKEKEFEFGRWYKDGNYLYFIDNDRFYGFSYLGHWVDKERVGLNMEGWKPATDDEVKERLLAYAMEKYPIGTKVKSVYSGGEYCTDSDPKFYYTTTFKQAIDGGFPILYGDGKWAKIISEPEKRPLLEEMISDLNHAEDEAIKRREELFHKILNNLM